MPVHIQVASLRSGVTPHVIRIWERRYRALSPERTCTNRRLYCEEDITRLSLLRQLTECGHRIGNIAARPTAELTALLEKSRPQPAGAPASHSEDPSLETLEDHIRLGLEAARAYDSERLRRLLQRARLQFGQRACVRHIICPLIHQIGEAWQQGGMRPGHEHTATAVLREYLMTPVPGSQTAPSAPEIIITTPAGEVHELGALLATATARDLGWRVTYLGPNLPTEEIAICARTRQARAVALSVVYPTHCPVIQEKLRKLRSLLPESVTLIIGGRAASSYAPALQDLHIRWAADLPALDEVLLQTAASPP